MVGSVVLSFVHLLTPNGFRRLKVDQRGLDDSGYCHKV